MRRYLSLLGLFFRVNVQDNAAYRLDFAMHAVLSFVQLGAELIGIWTIFSNTRAIGTWGPMQVLALFGVFRIMIGVIGMIIAPNMRVLMEEIRDGKLDYAVLKPVNTQFYVSTRKIVLYRIADIVHGALLLAFAGYMLSAEVTLLNVLLFVLMLVCGLAIIYSFWLVLGTMAFWFTRINNIEMVFWNVFEAGRYPVTIYRPWMRWLLTYVVPLAFLTTFPAASLLGMQSFDKVGIAVVAAVVALTGSSLFFRYGLRHYSGASA